MQWKLWYRKCVELDDTTLQTTFIKMSCRSSFKMIQSKTRALTYTHTHVAIHQILSKQRDDEGKWKINIIHKKEKKKFQHTLALYKFKDKFTDSIWSLLEVALPVAIFLIIQICLCVSVSRYYHTTLTVLAKLECFFLPFIFHSVYTFFYYFTPIKVVSNHFPASINSNQSISVSYSWWMRRQFSLPPNVVDHMT